MKSPHRYFLVGGAGFLGSHLTDRLLSDAGNAVTLFDNFSSGREWHFEHHQGDPRFVVIRGDVTNLDALVAAMQGQDTVVHLASNPDIARAAAEPDIDFREGTFLTNNVVEAMRRSKVRTILYASGSGIYGDLGEGEATEDHGPLLPISTYGASKLAGEALISAYCHMFEFTGRVFRFGNIVGPRQTHGVGFDFLRQLLKEPTRLRILGDGTQSKSYIHVSDAIAAVLLAAQDNRERFSAYNVATGDYITVTEIAHLAAECAGLKPHEVQLEYAGGSRGWKGDIPVVRLNTDRIRRIGWVCDLNSREALRQSMLAMLPDLKTGKL